MRAIGLVRDTTCVNEFLVTVVEDDHELRGLLVRGLRAAGFGVSALATGGDLLRRLEREQPDLLVLDIGLPDADGRDVCLTVRARGHRIPVIFLTARDAVVDRVSGFEAGGDDYLTKPFAMAELVVRARALLRRLPQESVPQSSAELTLDPAGHRAKADGAWCNLTPTEFRLLASLASRPGEAVRRETLIAAGWPHGAIVHDNSLDAFIVRLRKKLRELPSAPRIATVHGVGYRFGT